MPTPPFELCTEADVYNRIGGQRALAQLIDPDGTGTWSTAVVTLAIRDATNQVVMAAGVQSVLSGMTNAQAQERFPELVTITAQLSIGLVWDYGTSGRARPDGVQNLYAGGQAQLQLLATRQRKHGATDYSPAPNQAIRNIDSDPNQTRSLGTISSWQRGWM